LADIVNIVFNNAGSGRKTGFRRRQLSKARSFRYALLLELI
jgi:hypothetical protein